MKVQRKRRHDEDYEEQLVEGLDDADILTEEEINLLASFESFEDLIPNKIHGAVSGFLISHDKENVDEVLTNTLGIASDVTCGAINIAEGAVCEAIDITANLAKRGTGVLAGVSRSIVKTFTLGYSKNKAHFRNGACCFEECED